MDSQGLQNLFATSLSADPNVRKRGELEIRKIGGEEGLLPALMQIIADQNIDQAIRQACCVWLKNRIQKAYYVDSRRTDVVPISEGDKQALKASFLRLIIAAPSRNTRLQLAQALRTIISFDFPANWPNLLGDVQQLLSSTNVEEIVAGCVSLLEIVKSFRYRQGSDVMPPVIEATFPSIVDLGQRLLSAPPAPLTASSAEIPYLLHMILKTYKTTLVLRLSPHQQSSQSIVPWGRLLFAVINIQVPKELLPEDEDDREKCEWWKAKKWAYGTLDRLFHRYGNPSQLPSTMKKDYGAFSQHFMSAFAPEIIKTYLQQVELYISGQAWLSRKCQYLIFQFFTECVKAKATWTIIKPHFESLVSNFIFPQLSFTNVKREMWAADPVEYIRTSIDEYEDYSSPVSSATSFLISLTNNRSKITFVPILNFINSVLDGNPTPPQKFGALNMTVALSPFIMRNKTVRPAMEQFMMRHIVPDIASSEPYLRAIACEAACTLVKFELEWTDEGNLSIVFQRVLAAMDDPELPVRVHAAMALIEMIQQHTSVAKHVGTMVGKVVTDLLKLSDETDLDVLNNLMEVMVEQYKDELLPVASQLTARLCASYTRLLQEANAVTADPEDGMADPEDKAVDDDKTFAAMGVAKTIGTIVSSVDSSPQILNEIQQVIIPIIIYTLDTKSIDLFDNMYDLVDSLTFNLRAIAPQMWPIFESTYVLFKSDAIDFLDEMLPALDNFLSYGKEVFISRPDYVEKILDIYLTAMTSDVLGESDRCNGCKLVESLLLNLRGHVDGTLQTIITTSMRKVDPAPETRALQLANLEVLINAVLYNAAAALHLMEAQDSGTLKMFFTQWFELLNEDMTLPRVHDKKLSILAMCGLLTLDASQVPHSLQDGWTAIVSGILMVFKSLPRAMKARRDLIEKANETDDEEETGDDEEEGEEEEEGDDDRDVWDEDSQYVEFLAQEGARLRAKQEGQTPEAADEEDVESSDDEELEEDLGFISPLENVDPYTTFKHALSVLQDKNPAMYSASTTALNMDLQTVMMEVMRVAEQGGSA